MVKRPADATNNVGIHSTSRHTKHRNNGFTSINQRFICVVGFTANQPVNDVRWNAPLLLILGFEAMFWLTNIWFHFRDSISWWSTYSSQNMSYLGMRELAWTWDCNNYQHQTFLGPPAWNSNIGSNWLLPVISFKQWSRSNWFTCGSGEVAHQWRSCHLRISLVTFPFSSHMVIPYAAYAHSIRSKKAQHFRFNEFTKVLAVDCAYHFEKVKFFQEAKKVVPGIVHFTRRRRRASKEKPWPTAVINPWCYPLKPTETRCYGL